MRKFCLVFLILLFLFGCSEDSEDSSSNANNISEGNRLAQEGMEMLNEEILDMTEDEDIEIDDSNDLMYESIFNSIEEKFTEALEEDADNPMASLGMGILEVMRLNYDSELWSIIDEFLELEEDSGRHPSLFSSQFELLGKSPFLALKTTTMVRGGELSIQRIQEAIDNCVLPQLNSSLSYLENAISLADSNAIIIDTGEEFMEIDCGEVYAFEAGVKLLEAAFEIINAYDLEMVGEDGSHDWFEEIMSDYEPPYPCYWDTYPYTAYDYSYNNYTNELDVHLFDMSSGWYSDEYSEMILERTFCYNLQNNSSFGRLRSGYLNKAQNDILDAIAAIDAGIQYIENENDNQSNDIIKLSYIEDLEDQIDDHDDNPEFMQDWHSISDGITWLENLVSGSVELTANEETFTVDLDAFFSGAIDDIKDYLPYYHWNDLNDNWMELVNDYYYHSSSSHYQFFDAYGNYQEYNSLNGINKYYDYYRYDSGYSTDEIGNGLENDEDPYLPDYSFNGIFPGMTRYKFWRVFD